MPCLATPGPPLHASFLAAMAEFSAEGRGAPDDDSMIGSELREFASTWHAADGFAAYLAKLRADADPGTPRPAARVPCTTC